MEGIDTALIDALDAQKDKATTRYASYRRLNQFIRGVESVNKPSASEDDYEVDDATNNLTFVGDPDTVVVVGGEITGTNGKFKPLKPLKPVSPLNPYLPPGVKVDPNPSKNPGRLKPATEPTKVKPEVKVEVKPEVKVEVKPEVKTVSPVVKSEPPILSISILHSMAPMILSALVWCIKIFSVAVLLAAEFITKHAYPQIILVWYKPRSTSVFKLYPGDMLKVNYDIWIRNSSHGDDYVVSHSFGATETVDPVPQT
jgi:hypothetical protein